MSIRPTDALERGATPWLFAAALATTLPHFEHQPLWLSALTTVLFAWGAWLWWRDERLPGRWPLALLVAIACGGVLFEFRTLFGRDAGVAMLVVFMAMKLLELRSRRDATVVVMLGYFLLLTHYFYSQSIPTGLWLLAAMTLVTAALVRLHGGAASTPAATLRYAGLLMLQAVPFMLVLFLLFPRVSGPLWGLPQDAHNGRTGLSDQMAPGNIANLALRHRRRDPAAAVTAQREDHRAGEQQEHGDAAGGVAARRPTVPLGLGSGRGPTRTVVLSRGHGRFR